MVEKIFYAVVGIVVLVGISSFGCSGCAQLAQNEVQYNRLVQRQAVRWATQNTQYQIIPSTVFCEPRRWGNRQANEMTFCSMRTSTGLSLHIDCLIHSCRVNSTNTF